MKLLELLYNQENQYIDEIDRLEKSPDDVIFIEAKNNSGWVCLKAQENSFDWNIVRLVGNFDEAKEIINIIPFNDYVLLVDKDSDLSEYTDLRPNGNLIYYENRVASQTEYDEIEAKSYLNFSEIGVPKDCIRAKASSLNSRIDDLFLVMRNIVCGYIKIIKTSWHYAEVAIEINSEFRNQGFGTALMELMTRQFAEKGLRMSYVVENDNIPSVKLAQNYLQESFRLNKYVKS